MSGYPDELKYYMWGWQVHFRISCQTGAETLFNQLDRGLNPHVFLVGIARQEIKGMPAICFEPEDHEFFLDDIKKLDAAANQILEDDPDKNMLYSGPGMQEEMETRRVMEATRKGIETVFNASAQNTPGYQFHCSKAASVGNYHVYVVLGLIKEVADSHTHLMKNRLERGQMRIYQSVIETAVDAYLDERYRNLYLPDAGRNLSMDSRPAEDLLREAARTFMYTVSSKGGEFMGLHGLFGICNKLSTYSYEGNENKGHLIIANKKNSNIHVKLRLKTMFEIDDLRKTRKLLQLSNDKLGVISDSYNILGLGEIDANYQKSDESIFSILFSGTHCWSIRHKDEVIMQMKYGLPEFPREVIGKAKFYSDIKRIFDDISEKQIENLFELAVAVTQQRSGAMLVIVHDAAEEAERLKVQSLPIEPVLLTTESVRQLSAVDGGILITTNGIAHAYGVILDGVVGSKGDAARGSRYNSAITYLEQRGKPKPTLIVVVSEDGMVDIIPSLRPKVKRSDIIRNLRLLKEVSEQAEPDVALFNKLMRYFINMNFYITKSECDQINGLRKEIESKRQNENIWMAYEDLAPHGEMDSSYYEQEEEDN